MLHSRAEASAYNGRVAFDEPKQTTVVIGRATGLNCLKTVPMLSGKPRRYGECAPIDRGTMAISLSNSRKQRTKAALLAVWTAVVAVIFAWQFVHYRGIVALVSEWQFGLFGRAYPLLGFLVPTALLASPGLILFWRARKRKSDERLAGATIRSAVAFARVLFGVAAWFGLAALVFLIASFNVSGNPDLGQRIDLAKPLIAVPVEGQTTITGSLLYAQTAALDQNVIFIRKSQRFAPIVAPAAATNDLQFFVELPVSANAESVRQISSVRGILQRNALPGEIVRLYRYAGFRVEEPYYVVFLDKQSIAWPRQRTAILLLLIGSVFGVLGLLQRRRIRRLNADLADAD